MRITIRLTDGTAPFEAWLRDDTVVELNGAALIDAAGGEA